MPARPSGKKLRVPDEVAELVRCSHPQLKANVKAALKDILEDPACCKALKGSAINKLDNLGSKCAAYLVAPD